MTNRFHVSPPKYPREGWEQAAKEMVAAEEDENPWGELPLNIDSDDEEWPW